MLVFDIETNGFLDKMDRIHCLTIRSTDSQNAVPYRGEDIEYGVRLLMQFDICGHNAIKFDIPAIQKIYPWFKPEQSRVLDTLNLTRLIWPDTHAQDAKLFKQGKLPGNMQKRHSLEAWGYRLGEMKGEYQGDPAIADEAERKARKWESWNQSMEDYCVQDVNVTTKLLKFCQDAIVRKGISEEAVRLEHDVQWIIARQERRGITFNVPAAVELYSKLVKLKGEAEVELAAQFGWFYVNEGEVVTKRSARYQLEELGLHHRDKKGKNVFKTMDFTEGVVYSKVKHTQFNPSSRAHIANRLKKICGWEPTEFTDDGKPKIDEAVLSQLTYPQVDGLKRYLTLDKRIGQLSEGKESWLKHEKDGVIYGSVITNGAVTGRMSHAKPNLGQVPASYSLYGEECRSLFTARRGNVLVGADAHALELCGLAGFMARFDGGAYVRTVLDGKKDEGTDIHSVNARALGLDPKLKYFDGESGRDIAKTWFYAFIYGAGDEKLGIILTKKRGQIKAGGASRKRFMRNLPALGKLVERVKDAVKLRGCLRGLDGRILQSRSQHSALNTLLQSAGAVQMKKALVLLDTHLQSAGLGPGYDYEFVLNVHDEWQIECLPHLGDAIGQAAVNAIKEAGEHFKFKCPLSGEYKIGSTWAETH